MVCIVDLSENFQWRTMQEWEDNSNKALEPEKGTGPVAGSVEKWMARWLSNNRIFPLMHTQMLHTELQKFPYQLVERAWCVKQISPTACLQQYLDSSNTVMIVSRLRSSFLLDHLQFYRCIARQLIVHSFTCNLISLKVLRCTFEVAICPGLAEAAVSSVRDCRYYLTSAFEWQRHYKLVFWRYTSSFTSPLHVLVATSAIPDFLWT